MRRHHDQAFFAAFFKQAARSCPVGKTAPALGFTLLETLVALAIVAVGFAGAFGAIPEGLGAQDRARNLEAATAVAQSVLAQGGPGAGTEGRFMWQAVALPAPGAAPPQPGAFAGQLQRVTVRWEEGRNTRTITLQTVRLGLLPRG